jgi:hypothetical protein
MPNERVSCVVVSAYQMRCAMFCKVGPPIDSDLLSNPSNPPMLTIDGEDDYFISREIITVFIGVRGLIFTCFPARCTAPCRG